MIEVKLNIDLNLSEKQTAELKNEFAYINSIRLEREVSPEEIYLIHDGEDSENIIASELLQPEPKQQ